MLKIMDLRLKIEKECDRKLEVLNKCFKNNKECETCDIKDECKLNLEDLEEVSKLCKELYSKDIIRGRHEN